MLKFNQRLVKLALLLVISIASFMLIIANVSPFAPSSRSKLNYIYSQKMLIAY
jgi:hypothetical protein